MNVAVVMYDHDLEMALRQENRFRAEQWAWHTIPAYARVDGFMEPLLDALLEQGTEEQVKGRR